EKCMARLVFGMNQSLDRYVDHMAFAPGPTLFRHFIEEAQAQAGSVYGLMMKHIARHSTIAAVLILVIAASFGVASAQRRTPPEPNYDAFYELGPDSLVRRGVPKGKVAGPFTLPSA